MSIAYYQAFLKRAAKVQHTLDKYPKIPGPVMQFLNSEHFMMNDYMLELVAPVADLIAWKRQRLTLLVLLFSSLLYRSTLITWKQSATSATSSLILLLVLYPNSTISTSYILFLTSFVFQLKGHAAPMDTLFSSLSYPKPNIKNEMMIDNLKIIGSFTRH